MTTNYELAWKEQTERVMALTAELASLKKQMTTPTPQTSKSNLNDNLFSIFMFTVSMTLLVVIILMAIPVIHRDWVREFKPVKLEATK